LNVIALILNKKLLLPGALLQSLQHAPGFDEKAFTALHQSVDQVTSIRINKIKNGQWTTGNEQYEPVPWSSTGYYLSQRPSFTLDPLFHAGAYYVQEASSMFLEQALKQSVDLSKPLKVLDLCAAPGGKSTLIQSLISKESLLVSNELIKSRVNVLSENITKWGADNVIVTNNDPQHFQRLQNYFDVIVVDAPCSGSGLFRKDPEAIKEWSENNVEHCCHRQKRILADVFPALKEGGVLIYSTCSYSIEEDEAIGDWMFEQLALGGLQLAIDDNWKIVKTVSEKNKISGYRFYPDKLKGEGFFICVLRKGMKAGGRGQLAEGNGCCEAQSSLCRVRRN
jgi:NOL1/NOP2/sun family putative RNA methylase